MSLYLKGGFPIGTLEDAGYRANASVLEVEVDPVTRTRRVTAIVMPYDSISASTGASSRSREQGYIMFTTAGDTQ